MSASTSRSRKVKNRPTGSYALALRLPSRRKLTVGRLGLVEFPSGHYIYFGSALGGLKARVARHLRSEKKLHWHADYLGAEESWTQAWQLADGQRWECVWATAAAATAGVSVPAPGFGSSDCRCRSHLVRVNNAKAVRELLRSLTPAPRRWRLKPELSS
ncbi:MAG: GIY-YIG nuclease family protein [Chloroflexi bacterium]|nr:GIY-YIG nuclease family protein [Chloroflexota bacterium]